MNNGTLRVEVSFVSPTPLSFTASIDFEDDDKRSFPIYVSGTADNCCLTNFIFYIRNPQFRVSHKEGEGPVLEEILNDNLDDLGS